MAGNWPCIGITEAAKLARAPVLVEAHAAGLVIGDAVPDMTTTSDFGTFVTLAGFPLSVSLGGRSSLIGTYPHHISSGAWSRCEAGLLRWHRVCQVTP